METPTTYGWDEAKEAANVAKHKVTFPFATRVFADLTRIVIDTAGDRWRGSRQGDRRRRR